MNSFTDIGCGEFWDLALTFQSSAALYNAIAGLHAYGQRRVHVDMVNWNRRNQ